MDMKELFVAIVVFVIGIYILKIVTAALQIPYGFLIIALFVVLGIAWFIKEVFG